VLAARRREGDRVFTPREKALVELLAEGHTDASAARRLGVSPRTVSYTVQSLMDRLEVDNRFQLGLALGLLGVDKLGGGPGAEDSASSADGEPAAGASAAAENGN
jgi:LuxR family transcriptional regulator of spore coat protein